MPAARRGLVAPQNTFIENLIRRSNLQHSNFCLSNARVLDYPIVYSSDGFCKMSGFRRADVIHRSSTFNFMFGELTDKDTIRRVEEALDKQTSEQFEILIYKKNKVPMWTLLQIAPIKNEKDKVVLFLCTFKDITALKQPIEDDSAKGMGRFARLARSVTRSRSVFVQVAQHLPNVKAEQTKQTQISQIAHRRKLKLDLMRRMMSMDAEMLPQYKRETPKTPPHIILHYSTFKAIWDWVILLLTFYTAVAVPFNVAFTDRNSEDYITMVVIDGIVDIVFFVDVILNFHTTFVGPGGEVVSDPKIIRMNYLKTWFIIDLLSCLPYDVINAFQGSPNSDISRIFSALKVVRLLRLGRVVRKLDHYIEYGLAFLVLLMLFFVLIAHWLACIWYKIGIDNLTAQSWLYKLGRDVEEPYNITNKEDPGEGPGTTMAYVSALYYTMSSLTSVGFGNISATTSLEKMFSIAMMILGSLLYASIFGNVATIFQQFTSNTARYHDMLHNVREFMKLHQVNNQLTERVVDYVVSRWSITKGIDTEKVLSYCPKDMKADVCVHLNRKVFNEHPAFRLASEGCLRALAISFAMSHSAPGDLLIHSGESIDCLFFVVSGSLEVIQDDEVVAILGKGDVFGDQFWRESTLGQSAANVKALTYCDLHSIKRDDLLDVLSFYTGFANSFARNMVLTYNLRHRFVFRKLSDVQREREQAEKAKNEPPIPANHPVRKMLNKFRKLSDVPEKRQPGSEVELTERVASPKEAVVKNNETITSLMRSRPNRVPEIKKNPLRAGRDVKNESKWGPFKKNMLNKTESTDSGILKCDQKLDEASRSDSGKENSSSAASTASTSSIDHQLLTSLMDIKIELKDEIERLGRKMNKMDEQISGIVNLLSVSSSTYNSFLRNDTLELPVPSVQNTATHLVKVKEHTDTTSDSSGLGDQRTSSAASETSNGSKHGLLPRLGGPADAHPPVEIPVHGSEIIDMGRANGDEMSHCIDIESPPSPKNETNMQI